MLHAGPVPMHILQVIFASYKPLGSATLNYPSFLKAMAVAAAEARKLPESVLMAVADLAKVRRWGNWHCARYMAVLEPPLDVACCTGMISAQADLQAMICNHSWVPCQHVHGIGHAIHA